MTRESCGLLSAVLLLISAAAGAGAPRAAAQSDGRRPVAARLSGKERKQIIGAANQAMRRYLHIPLKERQGETIPRRYWGEAIQRLKSRRVRFDRVNVAIVLSENDAYEDGLYVSLPLSSYAPGHDKRFDTFETLSKPSDKTLGTLYRYRIRKTRPGGQPRQ